MVVCPTCTACLLGSSNKYDSFVSVGDLFVICLMRGWSARIRDLFVCMAGSFVFKEGMDFIISAFGVRYDSF